MAGLPGLTCGLRLGLCEQRDCSMNTRTRNCEALRTDRTDLTDAARRRLLSVKGDPFLVADWRNVVFLHYVIRPEILRPLVPATLELELHEGKACISLVALTMRRFRPFR